MAQSVNARRIAIWASSTTDIGRFVRIAGLGLERSE